MPVPGPSALREAPSGEGGARRGVPAEPSSWGQRTAGGGRNFFQNLPLAQLRSEPGKGLGRAVGRGMGGRRDLLASHSIARPRKWRGRWLKSEEFGGDRFLPLHNSIPVSFLSFPGPFILIPLSKDQMTSPALAASHLPFWTIGV